MLQNSESETASNADNDGASTPRSSAKRQRVATPRGAKELVSLPEDGKAESNGGTYHITRLNLEEHIFYGDTK